MRDQKPMMAVIALLVLVAAYWGASQDAGPDRDDSPSVQVQRDAQVPSAASPLFSFEEVIAARASKKWMTVVVRVVKTLPDDNDGSQHQRFLVEGNDGNTVLVAHNIDLAKPIPLHRRDMIEIRGRYEWNEKGGVLHWTHHDPSGRLEGGWIWHADTKYR